MTKPNIYRTVNCGELREENIGHLSRKCRKLQFGSQEYQRDYGRNDD